MKKLLKKIWDAIANLFRSLTGTTRRYVPYAINIVEAVKAVMDSPVDDVLLEILKRTIPGTADDVMIDKVKEVITKWLPKILVQLSLVDAISNIEDENERLKAILERLKLSSDEVKNVYYHGLASLILEKLSDGELSWSDSVAISEYYYANFVKSK